MELRRHDTSALRTEKEPHYQAYDGQEQDEQYPEYFLPGCRGAIDDLDDSPDGNQQKYETQKA